MNYREAEQILAYIADRLQQERDRRGLSQKKLAKLSGVSRQAIGAIEKGQRSPSLISCLRLADALGLRLGDLLNSGQSGKPKK